MIKWFKKSSPVKNELNQEDMELYNAFVKTKRDWEETRKEIEGSEYYPRKLTEILSQIQTQHAQSEKRQKKESKEN